MFPSFLLYFRRVLWIAAIATCDCSAWCDEPVPVAQKQASNVRVSIWASNPTDELRLAAESLQQPLQWHASPTRWPRIRSPIAAR